MEGEVWVCRGGVCVEGGGVGVEGGGVCVEGGGVCVGGGVGVEGEVWGGGWTCYLVYAHTSSEL